VEYYRCFVCKEEFGPLAIDNVRWHRRKHNTVVLTRVEAKHPSTYPRTAGIVRPIEEYEPYTPWSRT
jgi:hypothetical protein